MEVLVFVGFSGLRSALPFRLQKQSTLLSETLGVIVFETDLAFHVAQ